MPNSNAKILKSIKKSWVSSTLNYLIYSVIEHKLTMASKIYSLSMREVSSTETMTGVAILTSDVSREESH